jgi:hypothetical protein
VRYDGAEVDTIAGDTLPMKSDESVGLYHSGDRVGTYAIKETEDGTREQLLLNDMPLAHHTEFLDKLDEAVEGTGKAARTSHKPHPNHAIDEYGETKVTLQ